MTPRRPLASTLAWSALAALLGCGGAPPPGTEAVAPIEGATSPITPEEAAPEAAATTDDAPDQEAIEAHDTPNQGDASAGGRGGDAPAQVADAPSRLAPHRAKIDPSIQPGLAELLAERPQEGNVWAGKLAGNGGRDVLIYIPPGADPARPFRLVYHFHGTNSEHVQRKAPGVAKTDWVGWNRLEQTLEGARALQDQVPENVALVYPFSAGKRMEPEWKGWSNKVYDRMWMRPAPGGFDDDFEALDREARAILTGELGVHPSKLPAKALAEGHSAGGIALWNIARSGSERVSDFLFLDAGFHEWADGCHAEVRAHRTRARVILVIRDGGIADPMQGPDPWCVEIPRLVEAWPEVQESCAADPKRKARGDLSCGRMRALIETWPKVQDWCGWMKDEMRGVDDVIVHRTKVAHGEQPRAFFGGLRIPELAGDAR